MIISSQPITVGIRLMAQMPSGVLMPAAIGSAVTLLLIGCVLLVRWIRINRGGR